MIFIHNGDRFWGDPRLVKKMRNECPSQYSEIRHTNKRPNAQQRKLAEHERETGNVRSVSNRPTLFNVFGQRCTEVEDP